MTRVLFLIDESSALAGRVAEGTKSKAECYANALNALLSQLAAGPRLDVAVVGYRLASDGKEDVGCRWGGPLGGRRFVGTSELEAAPLAVENRVRKIPGPGGYGVAREESVRFPIWYVPLLGAPGPRRAVLEFCRDLLLGNAGDDGPQPGDKAVRAASLPPLVIHLLGELPDEEGFRAADEVFSAVDWSGGPPLLFHAHLGSSGRVPSTVYPSSDQNLSPALLRHAFRVSSVLPEPLAASLRAAGLPLNPGARGLIYNARMVDLIRFLGLVKAYAAWTSEPSAEIARPLSLREPVRVRDADEVSDDSALTPTRSEREKEPSRLASESVDSQTEQPKPEPSPVLAEHTRLVVFVLDRSCQSPEVSAADPKSAWRRLQDRTNELIGQFARQAQGAIQAALVAYGTGPSGQCDVMAGTADPSPGPTWLSLRELADRAIRVEEYTDQVSNGIGGLLTIPRKRPVFFDLKPTPPASPAAAFAKIAEMLHQWIEAHPGAGARPVVVHCTRGQFEPAAIREAAAKLGEARHATLPPALYHGVVTETAHRSMTYPASPEGIESDGLRALWEVTSPLDRGAALAGKRPGVSPAARGMVINAAFDALTDVVGGTL